MGKVTIKDVAKASGVSTATVSRVLNGSGFVSDEIKERVYATVKKLNYQPNAIARSLKQHKTNTIGVVIPDISNPYFMTIAKALEDQVQEQGYNLIFCSADENPKKEKELLLLLSEKRVDAIVLATSGENEKTIEQISKSGIPIILLDRKLDTTHLKLDYIVEDNTQGAYELTKHILEQGHTHVGVVNGSLKVSTGYERYQGYKKAIAEFDIEEDIKLIYNGNFAQEDGRRAVDYFLNFQKPPTAIISFNNTMTFGVLLELTKRGIKIPEEMAVASYGVVDAAQLLRNSHIYYVSQLPYEMGLKLGDILLGRIQGAEQIVQETVSPNIHILQ